jgi:hypothetical protein
MTEQLVIADTPEKIRAFQLLAARGAIKLERVGLKKRGVPARKLWATHFKMAVRSTHLQVIQRIEAELESMGHKVIKPTAQ